MYKIDMNTLLEILRGSDIGPEEARRTMGLGIKKETPEVISQRIDAIIQELEELRKVITAQESGPCSEDLAQQLYGALGQGVWEEYDFDLDWKQFEE